ncbi:MAG: ABC-F family ATP-binding cassette domain-containing protein [Ruminococcus sp.]|nr:ABC-F family ATP-binding cassette domain-containing protein [Ruminococcus sp.]
MYYKITNGAVEIKANTILEEINIEIKDKDHIGIIGRNGSGKTTLLKALIDNEFLSEGIGDTDFNITRNGNFKIGYLNQNLFSNNNKTLLEEILSVYEPIIKLENRIKVLEEKLASGANTKEIIEYEKLLEKYKLNGGYTYKKEYLNALKKFGFLGREEDTLKNFSGGERTKIAFLKLLLSKPDLLILDEPTNHLDIETIRWLEEYLKNYPASFVIVSHDRMFLDKTVNKIYEIEYGATNLYYGNYTNFLETKEKNYEKALKEYELVEKEKKRLQMIADRFRYKPSKASMALSKLKQIERLPKLSKPKESNVKTFDIKNIDFIPSGSMVLTVNHLKIGYTSVLSEVTFTLEKGEKLGIIGENGIGKSTLIDTLMGKIPSIGGTYQLGNNIKIGYFNQQLDTLSEINTVYEEIKNNSSLNDFEIRSLLASFTFYENDLNKKVSVLSGGEKVLLELSKLILDKPNLLILDEPTNHLDILGKEKLGALLKEYKGTILFVTHDRYFLNDIATSILELKKDVSNYYKLTYNEYLEKIKEIVKDDDLKIKNVVEVKDNKPKRSNSSNKIMQKLEKAISKKEEELKILKEKIYEPEVYNDYEALKDVNEKLENLELEIRELMDAWEKEMVTKA